MTKMFLFQIVFIIQDTLVGEYLAEYLLCTDSIRTVLNDKSVVMDILSTFLFYPLGYDRLVAISNSNRLKTAHRLGYQKPENQVHPSKDPGTPTYLGPRFVYGNLDAPITIPLGTPAPQRPRLHPILLLLGRQRALSVTFRLVFMQDIDRSEISGVRVACGTWPLPGPGGPVEF